MIYFEVRSKLGPILGSNLDSCPTAILDAFIGKEKDNVWAGKARNAFRENEEAEVRLIIVNDKDLGNSTKAISRIANVYFGLAPQFKEIERRQRQRFDLIVHRFAHNLVDLDRKLKGHLEKLAPDTIREKKYEDFLTNVEERIKNNTRSAANDVCQIAHRAIDLEAQIAGLRVISGLADEIEPSLIDVNIVRAIFRLIQPFVSDLEKKRIYIENQINQEDADKQKVRVDPQLLNVALSQFFNNAVKYALPNSNIIISARFFSDHCLIEVHMKSRCIEEYEKEKIFEEKYKGRHARELPGNGIGLFMTKRALKIMNADISVKPEKGSEEETISGGKFCKNIFIFKFPRRKKVV